MIINSKLVTKETVGKLTIEIDKDDFSKKSLSALKEPRFSVQYNPTTISYAKIVDMSDKEQSSAKDTVQISKVQKRTLTLDLIFDTATHPDLTVQNVKQLTQPFELLTQPIIKKPNDPNGRPPYITFTWADESIRGFFKSFAQEFTLFSNLGVPQRAKVTLEFVEFVEPEQQAKEEGSGDPEHYYHVRDGETLQLIAHRVFGNQNYWRNIASYNNMQSFRDLKAGMKLMLPAIN